MNLLKSPLRRTTAAIAGAFIGLVGAVAFAGPASAHHHSLDGDTACSTDGKNWTVDWKLTPIQVPASKVGTIVELTSTAGTEGLKSIVLNGAASPTASLTDKQTFPLTTKSVTVFVKIKWSTPEGQRGHGDDIYTDASKTVNAPTTCKEPEQPEQPKPPAEPTPIVEMDCTTIVIGLDNPKDGEKITLNLETSRGEKRTLIVEPGEKKTEKFSAKAGFTVKVSTPEVEETTTIAWESPSEDCVAAGEGGGELPLTGANATTIAGVAGGVLLIGAALFFMARRRKVKFTA